MGWPKWDYVCGAPESGKPSFTIYCDRVCVTHKGEREGIAEWSPSTDPAADYEVLVKVRETWEPLKVCDFRDALTLAWARAFEARRQSGTIIIVSGPNQYQPGDYSRAALAAACKALAPTPERGEA